MPWSSAAMSSIMGPQPVECLRWLMVNAGHVVRGNHDDAVRALTWIASAWGKPLSAIGEMPFRHSEADGMRIAAGR